MTKSAKSILRSVAKRQEQMRRCLGGDCRIPGIWNYAYKFSDASDTLTLTDPAATFVAADVKVMSARFVISVEIPDRDGDVVVSRGCKLDNYRNNAPWLFSHNSAGVAIGKATDPAGRLCVRIEDQRILSDIFFDEGDPDSVYLFGKVERGYLRTCSIGFMPLEATRLEEQAAGATGAAFPGWRFSKWELLEISLCSVPSNPMALLLSDLKQAKISDRLRKSLTRLLPDPKHWSHGTAFKTEIISESSAADGGALVEPEQAKDGRGSDKQAYLFDKTDFTEQEATSWLAANGFEPGTPAHTEDDYVFQQFPADACQADSAREEDLADGVRAIVCQRKIEESKPEIRDMSEAKEGCTCKVHGKAAASNEVPAEPAGGETTEARSMPHGASMACAFHKLCKDHMDGMEPNSPMKSWMGKCHKSMCKVVDQHYAHLDLGIEPMDFDEGDVGAENKDEPNEGDVALENKDEGDEDHGDAEAERDDRDGDNDYEGEQGAGSDAEGMQDVDDKDDDEDEEEAKRLAAVALVAKRMSVKQKAMIKEASEHLDDSAAHSETPKMHKVAHRYHAEQLRKVLGDRATTEGQLEDEGRRSYPDAIIKTGDEEWQEVLVEFAAFREDLYSATARID